jgi:hypothetical protein
VGQFDALPDGIGHATHIQNFFRTDLSATRGWDGAPCADAQAEQRAAEQMTRSRGSGTAV